MFKVNLFRKKLLYLPTIENSQAKQMIWFIPMISSFSSNLLIMYLDLIYLLRENTFLIFRNNTEIFILSPPRKIQWCSNVFHLWREVKYWKVNASGSIFFIYWLKTFIKVEDWYKLATSKVLYVIIRRFNIKITTYFG